MAHQLQLRLCLPGSVGFLLLFNQLPLLGPRHWRSEVAGAGCLCICLRPLWEGPAAGGTAAHACQSQLYLERTDGLFID